MLSPGNSSDNAALALESFSQERAKPWWPQEKYAKVEAFFDRECIWMLGYWLTDILANLGYSSKREGIIN